MERGHVRYRRRQALLLAAAGLALSGGRVLASPPANPQASPAASPAGVPAFHFNAIDGGLIDLSQWRGRPVLVVNTASLCGFARQFDALQALQDKYGAGAPQAAGLVVLAVPSGDFRQELETEAEVKNYCEMNFDLTLQMTSITQVTGRDAHPFYRWLAASHGFTPDWNFNKVLLRPDGQPAAFWRSSVEPLGSEITSAIAALLPPAPSAGG